MRVLVVGAGGREHALAWALARSPQVREVAIAPGNGGTGDVGRNVPIGAEDVAALTAHARAERYDLVVVGPEAPLALGLVDALRAEGLPAFGPTAAAARTESSKAYSKKLMRRCRIATADFAVFTDCGAARGHLNERPLPVVVKASGLAAGKGAIVCHTRREAEQALHEIMVARVFGAAGDEVVIEDYLEGQEVTVLAFCDGRSVAPMILAQDHKAIYDGDRGPNTGGMGAYAPAALLTEVQQAEVRERVLLPVVEALAAEGAPYVGVLYAGLMLSPDGDLRVLEFNCRFGDPEAQAILPLLESDLAEVALACIEGRLQETALRWRCGACVCVVLASEGYPGAYARGHEISGLEEVASGRADCVVFHAGTRREDGRVLTNGGRVLGVTAWAGDLAAAIEGAYSAAARIHWPGVYYRRDIGAKGLAGPLAVPRMGASR